ncbi:hypothetical protein TrLO_g6375 [Triparma laevis f. longispina]|uniref:Uncharacterized protein n=1 Tax=Triparma laevis f. longispina TaxID=1714387 RepID=A0A9W7E295_9STRA|nr:hypothetical protein TrLO_g6375 [Triparma laevis f. longispina]
MPNATNTDDPNTKSSSSPNFLFSIFATLLVVFIMKLYYDKIFVPRIQARKAAKEMEMRELQKENDNEDESHSLIPADP